MRGEKPALHFDVSDRSGTSAGYPAERTGELTNDWTDLVVDELELLTATAS
jgi:hypothetical protein